MIQTERDFLMLLGSFYLDNQQSQKALTIYRALHELDPHDITIRKSLSYAYLLNGNHKAALLMAEGCRLPQNKTKSHAWLDLVKSKALWGMGQPKAARGVLARFKKFRSRKHGGE